MRLQCIITNQLFPESPGCITGSFHSNAQSPKENMSYLLCSVENQIGFGFTFLVPAHPGSPGQNPESRKTVVVVVVQ